MEEKEKVKVTDTKILSQVKNVFGNNERRKRFGRPLLRRLSCITRPWRLKSIQGSFISQGR